ncbi:hypothetical protein CBOM_04326 [Ceraceosorus bombacis]|uniref:Uncharacterized protein n=1 Tax=Ceraceosorus bombacis TaxID=401625 RepID=A0A0P1BQ49_9BASI|nr:hypothetical protein CBOM_04326 [Ceraceosorus bombacis]
MTSAMAFSLAQRERERQRDKPSRAELNLASDRSACLLCPNLAQKLEDTLTPRLPSTQDPL